MIKLAIIENNKTYRNTLRSFINNDHCIEVIYEGSNTEWADDMKSRPDVIVIDIDLGQDCGINGIKLMKKKWPQTAVLVLTSIEASEKIMSSIKAGAGGYLLKKDAPDKIIDAIKNVSAGEGVMNGLVAKRLFDHLAAKNSNQFCNLTNREKEIVDHLMQGLSYKQVAAHLFISIDTLNSHVRNIYSKLRVHSKGELIAKFG